MTRVLLRFADPLDLPLEYNARVFAHTAADFLAEIFDIGRGGVAAVDQEIAVHLRHLRAADDEATAARSIDDFPRAVAGRILERRAAGLLADRLRGFAVRGYFGHARGDRIFRFRRAAIESRREDVIGRHRALAIRE